MSEITEGPLVGYLERAVGIPGNPTVTRFQKSYFVLDATNKQITNFPDATIKRGRGGADRIVPGSQFVIDLRKVSTIHKQGLNRFDIIMTSGKLHKLRCSNEQETKKWIKALKKLISPKNKSEKQRTRNTRKTAMGFLPSISMTRRRKKKEPSVKSERESFAFTDLNKLSARSSRIRPGLKAIKSKKNFKSSVDLNDVPPPPPLDLGRSPPLNLRPGIGLSRSHPSEFLDIPPPPPLDESSLELRKPLKNIKPRPNLGNQKRPTAIFNSSKQTISFSNLIKPQTGGDIVGAHVRQWSYVKDGKSASVQALKEIPTRRAVRPQTLVWKGKISQIKTKTKSTFDLLYNTLSNTHSLATELFKDLDEIAVKQMVETMFRVNALKGEKILTQGVPSSKFYVVEEGTLFVYVHDSTPAQINQVSMNFEDDSEGSVYGEEEVKRKRIYNNEQSLTTGLKARKLPGHPRWVASKSRGAFFGELSLLYEDTSNVTVTAASETILWAIDRSQFHQISTEASQRKAAKKLGYISKLEIFHEILDEKEMRRLTEATEYKDYKKGETILYKAESIKKIFWVTRGNVLVFDQEMKELNVQQALNIISEGTSFGETAFFGPAQSDYHFVANCDVTLLELDVVEAEEIIGSFKDVLKKKIYGPNIKKKFRKNLTPALEKSFQTEITKSTFDDSATEELKKALMSIEKNMESRVTSIQPSCKDDSMELSFLESDYHETSNGNTIDVPFDEVPPLIKRINLSDLVPIFLLGSGSFGSVHLMKNIENKSFQISALGVKENIQPKLLALKIVGRHNMTSKGWQVLMTNEKMAWAEVSYLARSPFVVQLYHTFADIKNIYFLLEACTGGDLHHLQKCMPGSKFDNEDHVKFFMANAILALQAVHSRSIIFRDLKPENLLISRNGYLKLTDFGLAKKSLRTFTICGTADYIAPEIILRKGHDTAVDFWSLGVLLFELTTGLSPFTGRDPSETHENVLSHHPGKFEVLEKRNLELTHDKSYYEEKIEIFRPKRSSFFESAALSGGFKTMSMLEVEEEDVKDGVVYIPAGAFDLMNRLMDPKKTKRLGCLASGIGGIQRHGYFRGFDWEECEEQEMRTTLVPTNDENNIFESDEFDYDPRLSDVDDDSSQWTPKVNTLLSCTPTFNRSSSSLPLQERLQ